MSRQGYTTPTFDAVARPVSWIRTSKGHSSSRCVCAVQRTYRAPVPNVHIALPTFRSPYNGRVKFLPVLSRVYRWGANRSILGVLSRLTLLSTIESSSNRRRIAVEQAAEAMDRAAAAPLELEDKVPARYVRAFCGNEKHARQRWRATLKWRKENEIDSILNEPQPLFHDIRRYFPSHM